jgi:3-hydroxybutyryl-CoA dehydratase
MANVSKGGHFFEDLTIGMEASYVRRVREEDVAAFAELTGDTNPIHFDQDYAAGTRFKGRIVHGSLTAGYISTILGTLLPGPGAIYVSQSLNFRGPVRIGDNVVSVARVLELLPAKKRVILTCHCSVEGKTVLEGEALLLVPSRDA